MNTKVNIAGIEFKNPVMTASGTFGSGMEYSEFVDLNRFYRPNRGLYHSKVWQTFPGPVTPLPV